MNQEQKNQMRNVVFKNLDTVLNNAKDLAKMFKSHGITQKAFEEIVSGAKVKVLEDGNQVLYTHYNEMLDMVFNSCRDMAAKMDTSIVPIEYIRKVIQATKASFSAGLNATEEPQKEIIEPLNTPVHDNSSMGIEQTPFSEHSGTGESLSNIEQPASSSDENI